MEMELYNFYPVSCVALMTLHYWFQSLYFAIKNNQHPQLCVKFKNRLEKGVLHS